MQKELWGLIEQANHDWRAHAETERDLGANLATRLSAVGSVPDAAQAYQEWMTKRMEMLMQDSRKFFVDSQKFTNSSARLFFNGWQGNSS
jgi:hypothetical protein